MKRNFQKTELKKLTHQLDIILSSYKNLDETCDKAVSLGCLEVDKPLWNAIWYSFQDMLGIVEKQFDTDWISWYIWHNQCGSKGLSAKSGDMKKMKKIRNVKDLAGLILNAKGEAQPPAKNL
jgi:hypothetical protein